MAMEPSTLEQDDGIEDLPMANDAQPAPVVDGEMGAESEENTQSMIMGRLDELPDNQKELVAKLIQAPEVVAVMALIFGSEIADALAPFMDPNKTIQIIDKPQQQQQPQQAMTPAQPASPSPQAQPMSQPPQGGMMAPQRMGM